jgi:hypothetical protein
MNSITTTRERIEPSLHAAGFLFGVESIDAQQAHFYRRSALSELHEIVELTFAGRFNEAVVGWVGISIPRVVLYGGLTEQRVLMELATDLERGLAVVETAQELRKWERRFVEMALGQVVPFANEKGVQVLAQTREARTTAGAMLDMVDVTEPWDMAAERLRRQASELEIADVERLVRGGLVNISNTQDAYRIACFALQRVRRALIGPLSRDRTEFQHVAWPIQIVADQLIGSAIERGIRGHER